MNGSTLTLGLVGALAAAGALGRRGSRDTSSGPPWTREEVRREAGNLKQILDLKDVRVGPKDQLYLLAPARHLEGLLRGAGRWKVQRMLTAARLPSDSVRSYMDNLDIWDGLADAVKIYLQEKGVQANPEKEYDDWSVEVIPEPGRPRGQTWSALKTKVIEEEKVKPFRFCAQPPVPLGSPLGPALANLDEKGVPPVFLSHGVSLEGLAEVQKCGGFLWPSFALTWRVPEGYGDVVFLADASLLASLVKPSGSPSSNKHVYLAGTDIWSPTAKELVKTQGQISKQLHGQGDRGLQSDLLISSAKKANWDNLVGTFAYSEHNVKATDKISTRKGLTRALKGILQQHATPANPYGYPEERNRRYQAVYRYPYAEMKVAGVVKPADMVACLYPRALARKVGPILDKLGFQGFRIPFDGVDGLRSEWDHDSNKHHVWASSATQALLAWAKNPCSTPGVRVGAAHDVPDVKAPYEPTFDFYDGFRLRGGHGPFAWSNEKRGRCAPASGRRGKP